MLQFACVAIWYCMHSTEHNLGKGHCIPGARSPESSTLFVIVFFMLSWCDHACVFGADKHAMFRVPRLIISNANGQSTLL